MGGSVVERLITPDFESGERPVSRSLWRRRVFVTQGLFRRSVGSNPPATSNSQLYLFCSSRLSNASCNST